MDDWRLCELNSNGHEVLDEGWIQVFGFDYGYISKVLTEVQMKRWRYNTLIFISAQTGMGKSTLILTGLLPIMKERNKKILILCSRTALKRQYKHNVLKFVAPEAEGDLTEKGLDKKHDFGTIHIYSYQEFLLLREDSRLEGYGAVVLDEAHFFINDASFNQYTKKILTKILRTQRNAIRIYMTETPDVAFEQLIEQEKGVRYLVDEMLYQQSRETGSSPMLNEWEEDGPHVKIYDFKRNYSYLGPLFFRDSDKLLQLIKGENNGQKWLIFISDRKAGKRMAEELEDDLAEYIDAELKEGEKQDELSDIIQSNSFRSKVLIVTKFLDVGVDLWDEKIENIVVFPTNKTDFLQMVGRKRVRAGERIRLYIHVREVKEYRKRLNALKQKYRDMIAAINSRSEIELESELPFPLFLARDYDNRLLVEYNGLSAVCIKQNIAELEELLKRCEERSLDQGVDEVIARYYLSWLDKDGQYSKCLWIDGEQEEIVNLVADLIAPVVGSPLAEEKFREIKIELLKLYDEYTRQHNLEPIRKDRREDGLSVEKTRKFFKAIQAPFTLSGKNNGQYMFERGESA